MRSVFHQHFATWWGHCMLNYFPAVPPGQHMAAVTVDALAYHSIYCRHFLSSSCSNLQYQEFKLVHRLKVVRAVHFLGRRPPFRRQLDQTVTNQTIPFTCTTMSPTSAFGITSDDALSALSESLRTCIGRLCKHEPEQFELTKEYVALAVATFSGRRAV